MINLIASDQCDTRGPLTRLRASSSSNNLFPVLWALHSFYNFRELKKGHMMDEKK
jgi:hypothetical protein